MRTRIFLCGGPENTRDPAGERPVSGAILVPFGELEDRLDDLRKFADKDIHVVCRTGHRSDAACKLLAEHGFTKVKNVVPGMSEWTGPVEQA